MSKFTSIIIIYNPISTGPSKELAYDFSKVLRQSGLDKLVRVVATKYAGHAEQLAYKFASASKRPLIMSSSGDGGYNEVVNGVMKASVEGAKASAGLLPAGNANDHYNYLHNRGAFEQIVQGKPQNIDLLQVITVNGKDKWERYAHSYIGIGLTPSVGKELNKVSLNPLNEKWIALKAFYKLSPVRLGVRGQVKTYDSVLFANIGKMSKVLSLSDTASATDGKFELITFKHQKRSKLLMHIFRAATKGLQTTNRRTEYSFTTVEPTSVQLDGEISTIPSNTKVRITIIPKALSCIV